MRLIVSEGVSTNDTRSLPRHREPHALLARFDVTAHIFRVQRMADVTDRRVAFGRRAQFGILIDGEAARPLTRKAATPSCAATGDCVTRTVPSGN